MRTLVALGKATGLDYFFLGIVGANYVRDATRFSLLGLTAVRSNWTTSSLTLQLWHAPSGRMVWQSLGDCTEYTETVATAPVPLHIVTAEIASAMVNDLVQGRSRTTLLLVLNQPARAEPEPVRDATEAHPLPADPSDPDAYCPADKPEIEVELTAPVKGV
ncbi:MAG: hypothetical protein ACKPEA_04345 [Planctomycetota bacterium]